MLAAGKDLKKKLSTANKKMKKLEERFIAKVKEHKQSLKLVEENENTIEEVEEEIMAARSCLN